MRTQTTHLVPNADGEALNVKVLVPQEPRGTIVLHHGYGGSMKSPVVERLTDIFYQANLVTLVPDTRNSLNSSGGNIEDFTFSKHASDLADVTEWATSQDWFQPKLHMAGYSLGGYSASKVASKRGDVQSLLLVAPIFSGNFFQEGFEKTAPGIMNVWKKKTALPFNTDQGGEFDAPFRCWKEWLEANALAGAASFKGTVGVLSAGADSLVLPDHIRAAKAAFRNAAFSSERIPREVHGFDKYPLKFNDWVTRQLNLL